MKIVIPIPTHLFGLCPIALDLPEYTFYLARTPNWDESVRSYNKGMWTDLQKDIHGEFPNIIQAGPDVLDLRTLQDFDLLFTIYEGNATWTHLPLDLPIPQIWQAFGSYIHRGSSFYLNGDKLNPNYCPLKAAWRWENTVIAEANPTRRGKVIYISADPNVWNGWIGDTDKIMSVQSHKHLHGDKIFQVLRKKKWIDIDYTSHGIATLSTMLESMRHARCYVDATPRYSPAGYSKVMMVGVPTVARNIRDWNIWIENGVNGYLYNNPEECEQYIDLLLKDYDKAKEISENAQKRAMEIFNPKVNHDKWKELIEIAIEEFNK